MTEQSVTLTVGQTLRVSLPGHGSGGFVWSVTPVGDAGIIAITREAGAHPPMPPAGGPPPSSFSLDEVLVLTGLRVGRVRLEALLGRPGGVPPVAQRRIVVHVNAAPGG